nr:MAG TPA: hypothetical protein [Caudoviricetes sp.]
MVQLSFQLSFIPLPARDSTRYHNTNLKRKKGI